MKIVINTCFGGFGLSEAAMMRYAELKDFKLYPITGDFGFITYSLVPENERVSQADFHQLPLAERIASNQKWEDQTLTAHSIPRDDPTLVQVVEELGAKAAGMSAKLKVVEIPDDVKWEIEEYDGCEHVAEAHRTWT